MTYGKEFAHFGKKLFNLARILTFWQDETGPSKEKFGEAHGLCVPARKNSEIFLAGILHHHKHCRTDET